MFVGCITVFLPYWFLVFVGCMSDADPRARSSEPNGRGRGREEEGRKSPPSTPLKDLLRKKKVQPIQGLEQKEVVLNDYDLDAGEILSWLRGDTDRLPLDRKRDEKEVLFSAKQG